MAKTQVSGGQTALREFYNENEHAKLILDDFAARTNNQRVTKVEQILSRLKLSDLPRWAVVKVFRELGELGFGRFVEGRHGHPSRFVWSSSSVDVGRGAAGTAGIEIAPVPAQDDEEEDEGEEVSLVSHSFNLRPNLAVTIALPGDLTEKEAERLAGFLRTLPL